MSTPAPHGRSTPAGPRLPEGLRFSKGHGTRNDFVLLDDPEGAIDLDAAAVASLADRRSGVGGDGVIRAVRTRAAGVDAPADAPEWFMDYRNADGSIAEMCGNGVRVVAAFLRREGHVREDRFPLWTRAGVRTVEVLADPTPEDPAWRVRVGMGEAGISRTGRTVHVAGHDLEVTDVDMGNPHAVAFLPEGVALEDLDLTRRPGLSPEPEHGANIELVVTRGERHVAMRVHERGVGETESCGTGVAATAVAAALRAGDDSRLPWRVDVPGGTLEVGWTDQGEVTLAGAAEIVADGTLRL
ncbi:diaminopimelate epimerase [Brachybacterium squillarum]|uniref:diaminopimelate epimerase n=1 Tax=Brachybacterium squillarum TaxID=661979 RepID=UPI002221B1F9|nr:diaminopimelate epimerase [Brachybacterium squillarum]MCW1805788.1 diaminopimelate epimerase [Brachybacterium squillarum]